MKHRLTYVLLAIMLLLSGRLKAQAVPEWAARFERGKLILSVNLKWNDDEKKRFANLYDLDSLLMDAIFNRKLTIVADCTVWTPKVLQNNIIELSKMLGSEGPQHDFQPEMILLDDNVSQKNALAMPEPANYGITILSRPGVFKCKDGKACFFLPGNREAKKVYLSGTFNQWSTLQTPMQASDSGWKICLDLVPGKYQYKYIVDGKWLTDENNKQREKDGHRGYNSVVYCPNFSFRLKGYTSAGKVMVSGSFNDWRTDELQMISTVDGWILPMYLREGTHAYKFIVDGEWITDPDNKVVRNDGRGNRNSFVGIGEPLVFRLNGHDDAREVYLAGDFNGWNGGELLMNRDARGWSLSYVLAPGNYGYKFVVDGQWITDPQNTRTVVINGFENSLITVQPNHMFRLKGHAQAKKVIVSGSFNNWQKDSFVMTRQQDDWVCALYLRPGRYAYKFVVDGIWMLDEANPLWEDNEYGTGNSVIWIAH